MTNEPTEPSNELREAAAKAGMSPRKFVELSGKTSLAEWEAAREAEKAAEGGK